MAERKGGVADALIVVAAVQMMAAGALSLLTAVSIGQILPVEARPAGLASITIGVGMLAAAHLLDARPSGHAAWGSATLLLAGMGLIVGAGFLIGPALGAAGGLLAVAVRPKLLDAERLEEQPAAPQLAPDEP